MADDDAFEFSQWELDDLYWQDMHMMRESDPQRYHERMCEEGDGWSHGFCTVYRDEEDGPSKGEVECISSPLCGVLQCFTEDSWRKMREEISRSTVLAKIDLDMTDPLHQFPWECIPALFGLDQTHQHLQEFSYLRLSGISLGGTAMADVLPFLRSVPALRDLHLTGCGLDDEGAMFISEALQSVRIEVLILRGNWIGDVGVDFLLSAANSHHLIALCLENNDVGPRGYQAISEFLGRDDCSLEALSLDCNRDCIELMINSFPSTSKLKNLDLCGDIDADLMQEIGVSAQVLLLGHSLLSFDAICQANHQLRKIGWSNTRELTGLYPYVKIALETNARSRYGASIAERIRNKLRHFYFDGEYDVKPFAQLDVSLMPYVLELVTKKEVCIGKIDNQPGTGTFHEISGDNLHNIYWLIRNCHLPELFSFPSPESLLLLQKEARIRELEEEIMVLKRENEMLRTENNQIKMDVQANAAPGG